MAIISAFVTFATLLNIALAGTLTLHIPLPAMERPVSGYTMR